MGLLTIKRPRYQPSPSVLDAAIRRPPLCAGRCPALDADGVMHGAVRVAGRLVGGRRWLVQRDQPHVALPFAVTLSLLLAALWSGPGSPTPPQVEEGLPRSVSVELVVQLEQGDVFARPAACGHSAAGKGFAVVPSSGVKRKTVAARAVTAGVGDGVGRDAPRLRSVRAPPACPLP